MTESSKHNPPLIAAILPAFNEEGRVGVVLEELLKVELVGEVIVVNDGSTDDTAAQAGSYLGVKVVTLSKNEGKGAAIWAGINSTAADILVLFDADLVGLTTKHIEDLIDPLLKDESVDMTLGKFTKGRAATNFSQALVPHITGQRAFRRSFLSGMEDFSKTGFGVEIAFTKQAKEISAKVIEVIMPNVTHVMKEEKLGIQKGLFHRLQMYKDLVIHFFGLDRQ